MRAGDGEAGGGHSEQAIHEAARSRQFSTGVSVGHRRDRPQTEQVQVLAGVPPVVQPPGREKSNSAHGDTLSWRPIPCARRIARSAYLRWALDSSARASRPASASNSASPTSRAAL